MPRKPIREFDLNAFSGRFRAESDRACAVLGGALLDARLVSLYERRLRDFKDQLLTGYGPVSTFSARIRVARALAWISGDVHDDLDQVRLIRNEFSHNPDHELSFSDQSIADRCCELHVAGVLIKANAYAASEPHRNLSAEVIRAMGVRLDPPRQRFEITVEMLAQHLDELPADSAAYRGPNLQDDLWALGSKVNIKISATGTVGAAPSEPDRK
jgi:hypothetical protein